ncbi:glycosyltransferase [Desertivirga brevis]|uniref:glycosyltransferase n=1 Tax=Desertivirga brevis TaxID=2810310 RepID=UPI001A973638|nr:glycosyltransferase [Pedobacter sp. SYSU D00873]
MMSFAPIALFVYNRPDHTRRTIKFLQQNFLSDESRLFVFSDAAKPGDEFKVTEVREMLRGIQGFKSIEIIERERNFGLADSIIDGVTRLTEEYGRVIVFEDDLLSSPYTLQYFNEALQKYEHEEKVMHVCAYMYPLKNASILQETFFYRAAGSWGWATWKRAWKHFEPDIDKIIKQFDEKKINDFSIDRSMNFWKQVNEFKHGKNNSWAIRWYASIFLNNGLCLNPAHSLIDNIGHDGTGVHSGRNSMYAVNISTKPVKYFPEKVEENREAYLEIREFLKHRKGNLWQRLVRFAREKF